MSKTIENIRLYRINNGAHYHFMESVAAKAKADEKVKAKAAPLVTALEQAVKTENDNLLLSQKSALSDTIAEADRQRDNYYRGYRNGVKSFLSFPDSMQQAVAKRLWQHIVDYKIDPRMQLDRETGLLTNFIEDLEGSKAGEVAALSLTPFVAGMKEANDTVRQSLQSRDTEKSGHVMGAARLKTDEAYEALVRRVNAHAEIEGDADYAAFIGFVNQQIARYKEQVMKTSPRLTPKGEGGRSGKTGKSGQSASHAEELARLKTMITEYERSSHFTPGIVQFTGLAAGKDTTRAYQVYLSDQPDDLFWLTVKDGKLTEIEFKIQPGQPGGLTVEKIK